MNETSITLKDIATLAVLANGIIPADDRDAGAAAVHAGPGIAERLRRSPYASLYVDGLNAAHELARETFAIAVDELNAAQVSQLLAALRARSPAFFRQLRADVCALYLTDPGVWQRIGFPGPSSDTGGYPDFDQPQL
jgi:restriction endonuclease Mrr